MKASSIMAAIIITSVLGACGQQNSGSIPAQQPTTTPQAIAPQTAQTNSLISREQPLNAAPLGIEIGYANLAGVKEKLGSVTNFEDRGMNPYSGGTMLATDGAGLGVEGLSRLLLIFDKDKILAGVIMTLPKNPKDIMQKLSGKYQIVDNRIDTFMNEGYARLGKGDSLVEIDAPHLSFEMEVRYVTKQLMADFQRKSSDDAAKKRQEQTNKL